MTPLALMQLACAPTDEGIDPTGGVELTPDPHVQSYVPPTFPAPDPQRIVFIGDSITAGEGVANPNNIYLELLLDNNDGKWPDHADADLAARFGDLEVLDVSLNGATTASVLSGQLPRIDSAWGLGVTGQTLVVGTIGGNDALEAIFSGDIPAARDDILANFEAIVDFFQDPARFPDGTWIHLTNIYDPTDGLGQVADCFYGLDLSAMLPDLELINDGSLDLAVAQGWAWVDLRGHFLGHGFLHAEPAIPEHDPDDASLWFQEDCIHPNPRGHHELRRLFLAAIDAQPLALE